MAETPRRDRDGEPFEDDFTEDRGVRRPLIEEAQHGLNLEGDQISDDEPRKESNGTQKNQQPKKDEQPQKDNQP